MMLSKHSGVPSGRTPLALQLARALLLLIAVVPLGCAKSRYQSYAGPQRSPEQVARVHCREVQIIRVDAVDMRDQNGVLNFYASPEPNRDIQVDLTPGVHRLSMRYRRVDGNLVQCSPNQFSILYDFKANQDYAFAVSEINQGEQTVWKPELIDRQTKAVLATHETKPLPAKGSKPGTATVRGIGLERAVTATGSDVYLIEKNQRTERWVEAQIKRWNRQLGGLADLAVFTPSDPPEVKKPVQMTVGYGMGFFEFTDVAPGSYFVYFNSNTEMTFSVVAVNVRAGERLVDNVSVLPAKPSAKK